MKRVFHPTLNAWQDVPEGDVEAWSKAGWHKRKGKHVDDSEALPVGEGYEPADVVAEPVFDEGGVLPAGVKKVTGGPDPEPLVGGQAKK